MCAQLQIMPDIIYSRTELSGIYFTFKFNHTAVHETNKVGLNKLYPCTLKFFERLPYVDFKEFQRIGLVLAYGVDGVEKKFRSYIDHNYRLYDLLSYSLYLVPFGVI